MELLVVGIPHLDHIFGPFLTHALLNRFANMYSIMHKLMGVHRISFQMFATFSFQTKMALCTYRRLCIAFLVLSPNLPFSSFANLSFQKCGLKNCGSVTE